MLRRAEAFVRLLRLDRQDDPAIRRQARRAVVRHREDDVRDAGRVGHHRGGGCLAVRHGDARLRCGTAAGRLRRDGAHQRRPAGLLAAVAVPGAASLPARVSSVGGGAAGGPPADDAGMPVPASG